MELSLVRPLRKFAFGSLTPPLLLTIIYLLTSAVWIVTTDDLVARLGHNNVNTLHHLQHYKGLIFVGLSTMVLYMVSQRLYGNLMESSQEKKSLESRYAALSEAANEGIFDCDLQRCSIEMNRKMEELIQTRTRQLDNFWLALSSRMTRGDRRRLMDDFNNACQSDRSDWKVEAHLRDGDGSYRTMFCSLYIIRDEKNNQPVRLVGTVIDISELRNLQAERFEQKLRFRKDLAATFIRAQEAERNRWAQELHDNVGQLLTVGNLYLGQMNRKPESIKDLLPETRKLVADSLAEIRQLSATMKPPVFSEVSLTDSVRYLIEGIRRVKQIEFTTDFGHLEEETLTEEQKLLIYRIVQEQLSNIVKYAEAGQVSILFDRENDRVAVRIRDDGKGFDPAQVRSGIGLKNMRSRLHLYRGSLHLDSSVGNGCRLEAKFHLN